MFTSRPRSGCSAPWRRAGPGGAGGRARQVPPRFRHRTPGRRGHGRIDITQQGRPVCERLAEEIGETVNIAVMQEHYAINLYEVRGPGAVTAHNWVGELTPLHATSSGKVLLAHMPAEERAALLSEAGLKVTRTR